MRFFKYLILLFSSFYSFNLYAAFSDYDFYTDDGGGVGSTPESACSSIVGKTLVGDCKYQSASISAGPFNQSSTMPGSYTCAFTYDTSKCTSNKDETTVRPRLKSTKCENSNNKTVKSGTITIKAEFGTDAFLDLSDRAHSLNEGKTICYNSCTYIFSMLSGDEINSSTYVFRNVFTQTAESCVSDSSNSSVQDFTLTAGNSVESGSNSSNTGDILSGVAQMISGVQSSIASLNSSLSNAIDSAKRSLSEQMKGHYEGLEGLISGLSNSINGVHSHIDGVNSSIHSHLGDQDSKIQELSTKIDNLSVVGGGGSNNGSDNDNGVDLSATNAKIDELNKTAKESKGLIQDIKDWLTEPFTPPSDDSQVSSENLEIDQNVTENNYVSWGSSCPPDANVPINLMGQSSTLTLSWQPTCQLLATIRWAIIAVAYFAAAYIILGMR